MTMRRSRVRMVRNRLRAYYIHLLRRYAPGHHRKLMVRGVERMFPNGHRLEWTEVPRNG